MPPLQARPRWSPRRRASRVARQTSHRPPSISPPTNQHSSTAPSSTSMGAEATSLRRPANHDAKAAASSTVPLTAAIAIQATVDREDLLAWWQGALGEFHAVLGAQGLQLGGPAV